MMKIKDRVIVTAKDDHKGEHGIIIAEHMSVQFDTLYSVLLDNNKHNIPILYPAYDLKLESNDMLSIEEIDTLLTGMDNPNEKLNPNEAKFDSGKPKITLVPRQIIWDIAEVREYGNKKYGSPDNWKNVEPERYRDALCRHFLKYLDDPKSLDKESGIKHLKHMACNIAFLCEMEDKDEDITDTR